MALEAQRFLENTKTAQLSAFDIIPRSPEVFMTSIARALMVWHDSFLDAKRYAAMRAEIHRRLQDL
ncbi:MAG: hypothetical protein A3J79_10980 [Elusimicrobia bacterium RIFOXYB2_FULL_62_6]|nr:MAG: hypothetical protein A3J79_10980 [Elusimicrobia bacterium RIFOXYB2_FULL_62_6]